MVTFRHAALAIGVLVGTPAIAADLPRAGEPLTSCLIASGSPLLALPAADIAREVDFRFARAVATAETPQAIASSRPAFTWALETRQACGTAIGYLRGSVIDEVSIAKCDCFHDRMIGYLQ